MVVGVGVMIGTAVRGGRERRLGRLWRWWCWLSAMIGVQHRRASILKLKDQPCGSYGKEQVFATSIGLGRMDHDGLIR